MWTAYEYHPPKRRWQISLTTIFALLIAASWLFANLARGDAGEVIAIVVLGTLAGGQFGSAVGIFRRGLLEERRRRRHWFAGAAIGFFLASAAGGWLHVDPFYIVGTLAVSAVCSMTAATFSLRKMRRD